DRAGGVALQPGHRLALDQPVHHDGQGDAEQQQGQRCHHGDGVAHALTQRARAPPTRRLAHSRNCRTDKVNATLTSGWPGDDPDLPSVPTMKRSMPVLAVLLVGAGVLLTGCSASSTGSAGATGVTGPSSTSSPASPSGTASTSTAPGQKPV